MTNKKFYRPTKNNRQAGFSLLEVAISGAILMIGLVAILGVFALAVSTTQGVQLDQIAKQKAMDALESIYTARGTQQITFAQIANTGAGGIFTTGTVNGILTDGPDGLAGTGDDGLTPQGACPLPYQCEIIPGPDGILHGDARDITISLSNFTRTIVINNQGPNLNSVVVTIGYTTPRGQARNYTVQALISSYR